MKFHPSESADYVIARLSTTDRKATFSVVKFDGGDIPEQAYIVTVTPRQVSCTCPAYVMPDEKKPCRHCVMVALWVLNGDKEPEHYQGVFK